MKDCPCISPFQIQEAVQNNHQVIWQYEVKGWGDITKLYHWITESLKTNSNPGLKMTLTPYMPDYALGSQIRVTKKKKVNLAKKTTIRQTGEL